MVGVGTSPLQGPTATYPTFLESFVWEPTRSIECRVYIEVNFRKVISSKKQANALETIGWHLRYHGSTAEDALEMPWHLRYHGSIAEDALEMPKTNKLENYLSRRIDTLKVI